MNDLTLGIQGMQFALFAAASAIVYMGPLRWARIASWRQDLFDVRNRLWDQMRELNDLDHPAHRRIRSMINSMIRHAPVMNLFYIAAVLWRNQQSFHKSDTRDLAVILKEIEDPKISSALLEATEATISLFMRQLFLNSFPGVIVGLPILVWLRTSKYFPVWTWARRVHYRIRNEFFRYADRLGLASSNVRGAATTA